jgi:serine protease AprX
MPKITINGISLDPDSQRNSLNAANLISEDSSTSNYIIVQTSQPLDRQQKSELTTLGATILEYAPENTYICSYPPTDLNPIRDLAFVDWANIYLKDFKIEPRLRSSTPNNDRANLLELKPIESSISRQPKQVNIILHNNISIDDSLRERLAAAVRLNPSDLEFSGNSVKLSVQAQYLNDVAKIDEVRNIEEYTPPQLFNNIASGIINAERTHQEASFEGEGQIIAVCDTGLDKGSTTDLHPDFTSRVLKLYALGRSTANDPDGHGTHVAGSVLGSGTSATMGGKIQGTAPKAKLIFQSVLDARGGLGGLPNNLENLFKVAYNDGAKVHTNSWGLKDSRGRYTANSSQIDKFVWENRDLVICVAAGNDGSDRDRNGLVDRGSVTAPGTAKNCITVGATENNRPDQSKPYSIFGFSAEPIASDSWSNNSEGMAAFSSRGPTRDGRIKPDIVAPGTTILSTASRVATYDPIYGKSLDPLYAFLAGTSMATPLVAGCVAVIREYFQKRYSIQPSAALVKAMAINGAKNIAGQYVPSEAGAIPNFAEGFGRIDLAASTEVGIGRQRIIFKDEATKLDTGEEEKTEIELALGESSLKVTLVWTDPPGEALQNDLDLIVRRADGRERHGNVASSSPDFDRTNNVEQVIWSGLPIGTIDIIVRAHRILPLQSYALIVRVS